MADGRHAHNNHDETFRGEEGKVHKGKKNGGERLRRDCLEIMDGWLPAHL